MDHIYESADDRDSWTEAFETTRLIAKIPNSLPSLMRSSWNDLVSPGDFVRLLAAPGYSADCLIRAAHLPNQTSQISADLLREAVDILGVKAATTILAINCICERVLDSGPAARVWTPLFREMMSEIEIGYHLGSSVAQIGHERGMLMGFSRLAGLSLLMARFPDRFTKWQTHCLEGDKRSSAIATFGCEPYQVSSLLMQHLGLGAEVALATASALGSLDSAVVELTPTTELWRGALAWVETLKNGESLPHQPEYQEIFPELAHYPESGLLPEHIRALREHTQNVSAKTSDWTWHLPLPSYEDTAKAIVYRVNSNPSGPTWTKGLVVGETRS